MKILTSPELKNLPSLEIGLNSEIGRYGTTPDAIAGLARKFFIDGFSHWKSGKVTTFTADTFSHEEIKYEVVEGDRQTATITPYTIVANTVTLTAAQLIGGYLFIVARNEAIELTTDFANQSLLSDRIYLGVINIDAGVITSVTPFLIENNPFNQSTNLLFMGGIVNRKVIPFAKAGTRSFSLPAGILELVGYNFFSNINDPHKYSLAFEDVVTYDLCDPDGVLITGDETELDFSNVWDGTGLQVVNGNNAATIYIYYAPFRSGNKVVGVIGDFEHGSINNAYRDWESKENHVKPDWLGVCKLLGVWVGRVDFTDSTNRNQVSFVPRLDFVDSGSGAGTTITDGVLLEVDPANIGTIDPVVYHEFRTTTGEVYKTFDRINWELQ